MLTAISSGVSAPMESPMGHWTRARSASVKPCPHLRSMRNSLLKAQVNFLFGQLNQCGNHLAVVARRGNIGV